MNWNKHIGKKNRNRNGLADNWIKKVKELSTEKFPYVLMENSSGRKSQQSQSCHHNIKLGTIYLNYIKEHM